MKKNTKQPLGDWRDVANVPLSIASAAEKRIVSTAHKIKENVISAGETGKKAITMTAEGIMDEQSSPTKKYFLVGLVAVVAAGLGYGVYKIVNYQSGQKTTPLLGLASLGLN